MKQFLRRHARRLPIHSTENSGEPAGGSQHVDMKNVATTRPNRASATECNGQALLFPELTAKTVTVDFAGGHVSSDGGGVLLARLDRS
jgi:hypothetical protein